MSLGTGGVQADGQTGRRVDDPAAGVPVCPSGGGGAGGGPVGWRGGAGWARREGQGAGWRCRSDAIENALHDRQMVVVVLGDEVHELNRLHRLPQSWMQCCSDHLGIAETIEPFDKPTPGIGECR